MSPSTIFVITFTLTLYILPTISTIYRVVPGNTNSPQDGLSWANAYANLQSALTSADTTGDQIWLKGFETPSATTDYYYPPAGTATRSNCFQASEGVEIYGGFEGDESTLSARTSTTHQSIISGDYDKDGVKTDNCYHVITFTKKLKLDTVTIRDGYANYIIDHTAGLTSPLSTRQANTKDKYGGALINDNNQQTDLEINKVIFSYNTAVNGGALWFGSSPGSTSQVKITNSQFNNNEAIMGNYEGGYGGAIYLYHLANVSIEDTSFTSNEAAARGGAIYQDYSGILYVNTCTFSNNEAGAYGGAIFSEDRNSQANDISNGTKPEIESCIFSNNVAVVYGGALCFFNNVNATLRSNTFTSNTANQKGGAIAIIDAIVHVNTGVTYTSNVASADSSTNNIYTEAEYLYGDTWAERTITNEATEVSNYLTTLNAVTATITTDVRPWVNGTTVCRVAHDQTLGTAAQDGTDWTYAFKEVQDCLDLFENNAAGGEIWVKGGGTYAPTDWPSWKSGPAIIQKSFELFDNVRMYGGFAGTETARSDRDWVTNPTYLTCKIRSNKWCKSILTAADNTVIDGFIFKEAGLRLSGSRRLLVNSITMDVVLASTDTSRGAGIFSNSTNIVVTNSIFMNLFTSGKGGAVYCIGLEKVGTTEVIKSPSFINVAFVGNTANKRGGAICADGNCHFECDHCIFDRNKCAKKGGAIYLDFASNPVFTETEFKENEALESGGCIAADGVSFAKLDNPTFTNNAAKYEGGCLYSGSGVGTNIKQGFEITQSNGFGSPAPANQILNSVVGQADVYLWPYSIFTMTTESYSPTKEPTVNPTTSPTTPTANPLSAAPTAPTKSPTYKTPPNVIVFMMDDTKYTEAWENYAPGGILNGHTVDYVDISTPNIDLIRNEGIVFPRSYNAGPKCAPSRYGLLTGRYPPRGVWARSRVATADRFEGVSISVPTTKMDGDDLTYNLPQELKLNGYYTIHSGKWHISAPDTLNCATLDSTANATIYDNCLSLVTSAGFDCVGGFYYSNIAEDVAFSHNPEWMVDETTTCINNVITSGHAGEGKPFFLYFSTTLSHDPSIQDALENHNSKQTPRGTLANEITPTGMRSRSQIWADAVTATGSNANQVRKDTTAALMWLDDTLGALINYLKSINQYESTMIVVMNDHGMAAKGMLYEQGSRIINFVRYPKEFGTRTTPFVASDYIISNVDLAATIFQMAGITKRAAYTLDGTSWFNDIKLEIDGHTQVNAANFCCKERFIDMYKSHARITATSAYIYRVTNTIEGSPDGSATTFSNYYPNCFSSEQLYHLATDAGQQTNVMDVEGNQDERFENKLAVRNYIRAATCVVPSSEIESCEIPEITAEMIPSSSSFTMPTPAPTFAGYTCDSVVTWEEEFRPVRLADFNSDAKKTAKRQEAEIAFFNDAAVSCGEVGNVNNLEYIYYWDHSGAPVLYYKMIACCDAMATSVNRKHFGGWVANSAPDITPFTWSNSPALTGTLAALLPEEVSDLIGLKEIITFNIMATLCILCCIGAFCFYRKRKNDKNMNEMKQLIKKQKKQIKETNKNKMGARESVVSCIELSANSTRDNRESIVTEKIKTDSGTLFRSHSFTHSDRSSHTGNANASTHDGTHRPVNRFSRVNTYESESSVDSNHLNTTQFSGNQFSHSQSLPKKMSEQQVNNKHILADVAKNLPSPIVEDQEKPIVSFEVISDPNSPELSDS